ncbi:hypothetical protein BC832DRAFT_546035, partial [Gaertneriomyces semiglobifer]
MMNIRMGQTRSIGVFHTRLILIRLHNLAFHKLYKLQSANVLLISSTFTCFLSLDTHMGSTPRSSQHPLSQNRMHNTQSLQPHFHQTLHQPLHNASHHPTPLWEIPQRQTLSLIPPTLVIPTHIISTLESHQQLEHGQRRRTRVGVPKPDMGVQLRKNVCRPVTV